MKKAEYFQLEIWGWDCPKCSQWNETNKNPVDNKEIVCGACLGAFIPIEASNKPVDTPNTEIDANLERWKPKDMN